MLKDWDNGVCIIPEGQEILIGFPGFRRVARESTGAAELQVRQRACGVRQDNPWMVEGFLKFGPGFHAPAQSQISLAACDIRRVQAAKQFIFYQAVYGQFVKSSDVWRSSTAAAGFPRPSADNARNTGM